MSILQKQASLVEEFQAIPGWEDRYKKIIALQRGLAPLPDHLKTDANKVRGCASTVWMHAELIDGRLRLQADSDAILVRGLVALLLAVYSDEAPADIIASQPFFIEELGLNTHLSPNRANGLVAMIERIRADAVAAQKAGPRAGAPTPGPG